MENDENSHTDNSTTYHNDAKRGLAISTAYQVSEQIMKTTKVWSTVDMRMIS